MRILNEYDTIKYLIKHKASIARYGDGELRLCIGKSAKSQKKNKRMANDLKSILKSTNKRCLVSIPRIEQRTSWTSQKKKDFWYKYMTPKFTNMYMKKKVYGSAFITRPDAAPEIECKEYFDLVRQLWAGKRVILIQGEGQQFHKEMSLFDGSKVVHMMCEARTNAYKTLKGLERYVFDNMCNDTVVVISLGPSATILAHRLSLMGVQALDLGHLGQFYSRVHPKSVNYTGEPYEIN